MVCDWLAIVEAIVLICSNVRQEKIRKTASQGGKGKGREGSRTRQEAQVGTSQQTRVRLWQSSQKKEKEAKNTEKKSKIERPFFQRWLISTDFRAILNLKRIYLRKLSSGL